MNEERLHGPGAASARLIAALKSHLPQLMDKHQVTGLNIALADGGRLVWEAGYGLADIAAQRPMTPDTVYRSGSLGKVYTATAIMILVDRGVISLDDPINRHLPFEVRNPLGAREVTLRDLMTHTSGLGSDAAGCRWTPDTPLSAVLEAEYASAVSPMLGGLTPRWSAPVGETWTYSNLGIATLGLIVERANPAGLSFSDFVQTEIMDPLGMTASQYPAAEHEAFVRPDIWARASTGYTRLGEVDLPSFPLVFAEFPAGGVMQTPRDHVRLLLAMAHEGALDGHRLFQPEIARDMLSPATEVGPDSLVAQAGRAQGLVWMLQDVGRPHASFMHAGGHMFGWRTQGRAWPGQGAAVMIAVNQWVYPQESEVCDEIAAFVGNWLQYRPPIDPRDEPAPAGLAYALGAIMGASYHLVLGTPGEAPAAQLDVVLAGVRDRSGDWDEMAFRRGFEALARLPRSVADVQAFWTSPACEIDVATLRAAVRKMGATSADIIAALLPAE